MGRSKKPNLIFLMADQLRADVLGAYGDSQCPTPKLDLLASHSTVFDRHYTPCPLCLPARASIMTGLYPHQHGATINGWLPTERIHGTINQGVSLLPKHLIDAGYHVAHVGVQHVRCQPDFWSQLKGVEFHGRPGEGEHRKELEKRNLFLGDRSVFKTPVIEHDCGRPVVYPANSPHTAVFPLREELFYDSVLADKMIKTIESCDGDKPFAMFGNFWLPHPPLWAPEEFANLISPKNVHLPVTVGKWYSGMPVMQLMNVPGHLGAHVTEEQWQKAWAMYLGMVAFLDKCIGRVLAALDYAQMFEDSVIVVTSDHGEMLGCHSMYQKMCLYEDVARVPMMVKLPGQSHSHRSTALTSHIDVAATMLDFAGGEPMPESEGQSMRQLADASAPSSETRKYIFSAYSGNAGRGYHHRMVCSKTYKFIHNVGDRAELYDLIDDPRETTNLAGREEHAHTEGELRAELSMWMRDIGDDRPPG